MAYLSGAPRGLPAPAATQVPQVVGDARSLSQSSQTQTQGQENTADAQPPVSFHTGAPPAGLQAASQIPGTSTTAPLAPAQPTVVSRTGHAPLVLRDRLTECVRMLAVHLIRFLTHRDATMLATSTHRLGARIAMLHRYQEDEVVYRSAMFTLPPFETTATWRTQEMWRLGRVIELVHDQSRRVVETHQAHILQYVDEHWAQGDTRDCLRALDAMLTDPAATLACDISFGELESIFSYYAPHTVAAFSASRADAAAACEHIQRLAIDVLGSVLGGMVYFENGQTWLFDGTISAVSPQLGIALAPCLEEWTARRELIHSLHQRRMNLQAIDAAAGAPQPIRSRAVRQLAKLGFALDSGPHAAQFDRWIGLVRCDEWHAVDYVAAGALAERMGLPAVGAELQDAVVRMQSARGEKAVASAKRRLIRCLLFMRKNVDPLIREEIIVRARRPRPPDEERKL